MSVSGLEGLILAQQKDYSNCVSGFKISGLFYRHMDWKIVTGVSEERNVFIFRIRQSRKPVCSSRSLFLNILSPDAIVSTFSQAMRIAMLLGMLKCEDEDTTILRNVGICWLVVMA